MPVLYEVKLANPFLGSIRGVYFSLYEALDCTGPAMSALSRYEPVLIIKSSVEVVLNLSLSADAIWLLHF